MPVCTPTPLAGASSDCGPDRVAHTPTGAVAIVSDIAAQTTALDPERKHAPGPRPTLQPTVPGNAMAAPVQRLVTSVDSTGLDPVGHRPLPLECGTILVVLCPSSINLHNISLISTQGGTQPQSVRA